MSLKNVRQRYADALTQVPWQDFERLVASHYARHGYAVDHVGTAGAGGKFDGGIDLKLRRDGQYLVVQCKHWVAKQVPHNEVHQLLGIMQTQNATGGILVTSGEFTRAAYDAAAREPRIQLIDGTALRRMLGPSATAPTSTPNNPHVVKPIRYTSNHQTSRPSRHSPRSRAHDSGQLIALSIIAALVVMFVISRALTNMARSFSLPSPALVAPSPTNQPPAVRGTPAADRATLILGYEQGVPKTDEAMQDWTRRNAESMKILEKTTPEMPLR